MAHSPVSEHDIRPLLHDINNSSFHSSWQDGASIWTPQDNLDVPPSLIDCLNSKNIDPKEVCESVTSLLNSAREIPFPNSKTFFNVNTIIGEYLETGETWTVFDGVHPSFVVWNRKPKLGGAAKLRRARLKKVEGHDLFFLIDSESGKAGDGVHFYATYFEQNVRESNEHYPRVWIWSRNRIHITEATIQGKRYNIKIGNNSMMMTLEEFIKFAKNQPDIKIFVMGARPGSVIIDVNIASRDPSIPVNLDELQERLNIWAASKNLGSVTITEVSEDEESDDEENEESAHQSILPEQILDSQKPDSIYSGKNPNYNLETSASQKLKHGNPNYLLEAINPKTDFSQFLNQEITVRPLELMEKPEFSYVNEDEIDRYLKCIVCREPLFEPVLWACENMTCKVCSENTLKSTNRCPNCNNPPCKITASLIPRGITNHLNDLKVTCPACDNTFRRQDYLTHRPNCIPLDPLKIALKQAEESVSQLLKENKKMESVIDTSFKEIKRLENRIKELESKEEPKPKEGKPENRAKLDIKVAPGQKIQLELRKLGITTVDQMNAKLLSAVGEGNLRMCKLLLEGGASANAQHSSGFKVLRFVQKGNLDILNLLYEYGADVNAIDTKYEQSFLRIAVHEGDLARCIWLLEKGVDIDTMDFEGYTPMISSAKEGRMEICLLLANKGAKLDIECYENGYTALHWAAQNGHLEVCKILVNSGADVGIETISNRTTPLSAAAAKGHIAICRLLLANGAKRDEKFLALATRNRDLISL